MRQGQKQAKGDLYRRFSDLLPPATQPLQGKAPDGSGQGGAGQDPHAALWPKQQAQGRHQLDVAKTETIEPFGSLPNPRHQSHQPAADDRAQKMGQPLLILPKGQARADRHRCGQDIGNDLITPIIIDDADQGPGQQDTGDRPRAKCAR